MEFIILGALLILGISLLYIINYKPNANVGRQMPTPNGPYKKVIRQKIIHLCNEHAEEILKPGQFAILDQENCEACKNSSRQTH